MFRFLNAAEDLVVSEEQLELVMITAVFLASKASEFPARIRDVINVFWKLRRERQEAPSLDEVSPSYNRCIHLCEPILPVFAELLANEASNCGL
mgnify:CR=1 FL=1